MPRHSGVALVTVLFILAILATLAIFMAETQYLGVRRIGNLRDSEQAFQLALGAELWAAKVLERDMRETTTDHAGEAWNRLLPQVTVDEGKLAASVEDQQGRFNLNNLRAGHDTVWYPAFVRLLRVVGLEDGLADAVVDWIDADQTVQGAGGAEDADYQRRTPPYRAANRIFSETSELLWVAGFDAAKLAKLAPYVSALPQDNVAININTCSATVMRIVTREPLNETAAQSLLAARGGEGYKGVNDFLVRPELAGQGDTAGKLVAVSSSYFSVASRAEYGRVVATVISLIQRKTDQNKAVVLQRRRGWT